MMAGLLAPKMVRERADLARSLERRLAGRDIIGVGGILAILDENNPAEVRGLKGPNLKRLISFTMHDLGWEPHSCGHAGRVSSWRRPRP